MLDGLAVSTAAFSQEWPVMRCRACLVKLLGEPAVARCESGLAKPSGWEPVPMYAVQEHATEWGYEVADDVLDYQARNPDLEDAEGVASVFAVAGGYGDAALNEERSQLFSADAACVNCESCGVRLDRYNDEWNGPVTFPEGAVA